MVLMGGTLTSWQALPGRRQYSCSRSTERASPEGLRLGTLLGPEGTGVTACFTRALPDRTLVHPAESGDGPSAERPDLPVRGTTRSVPPVP